MGGPPGLAPGPLATVRERGAAPGQRARLDHDLLSRFDMTTTPHPLETAPLAHPREEPVARRSRRFLVGGALVVLALNAVGGGMYGLSGAEGVPRHWLEGSPFSSYFVPSLFLLLGVGGATSIAALAVLNRWRRAGLVATGAGLLTLAWIVVQVSIIGYVSWLQPATAIAASMVIGLSRPTRALAG